MNNQVIKIEDIREGMYVMYYICPHLLEVYEDSDGSPYIIKDNKEIFLKDNERMIYKVFEQEDVENFIKNFGKEVDR